MMNAVDQLAPTVGIASACDALGLPRASFYRRLVFGPLPLKIRPSPPRALSPDERTNVRILLNSTRFQDCAPAAIQATLLDEGQYLCSTRTMYRVLNEDGASRERRDQLTHPAYQKPELLATAPNQLWSWDITKLRGPVKWNYFYLYVILDVFSRYVVGWLVAPAESKALAERFIRETCERQGIVPGTLTVHADRGSSMKSKPVAFMLADLGVTKSHSRPHVSNDNPFSEAHFKTLKYRPDFPAEFGCIEDSRLHSKDFFDWYNLEHHHAGVGLFTPFDVHYGFAAERFVERAAVLQAAQRAHPERFVRGTPVPLPLPTEVWINKPAKPEEAATITEVSV
jgi:putative transposase